MTRQVVPLFAYPIAETELGHIQSHPGLKQFVSVSSSPTLIVPEEVTLLHTLPTLNFYTGKKYKLSTIG